MALCVDRKAGRLAAGLQVYRNQEGEWVEDERHSATLDRGWDLDIVRDAAYSALAKVGRERMHFRPPDEQNDHKVRPHLLHLSASHPALMHAKTA